jgi:hypothetical protein
MKYKKTMFYSSGWQERKKSIISCHNKKREKKNERKQSVSHIFILKINTVSILYLEKSNV